MRELNLTTKGRTQERILAYLQVNVSEILADKINKGVYIEKDGKTLINKKTLDGFMRYACEEARKLSEKNAKIACIDDNVVFGWAMHYFEEDSIEGTLYNEDGTEYKPAIAKPKIQQSAKAHVVKRQNNQASIFDFMEEKPPNNESDKQRSKSIADVNEVDEYDYPQPTSEEIQEILAELDEEDRQTSNQIIDQDTGEIIDDIPQPNPNIDQRLLSILSDILGDVFIVR